MLLAVPYTSETFGPGYADALSHQLLSLRGSSLSLFCLEALL